MTVHVRTATDDDALEVRRILDGAMLEPGDVEGRIESGDVLVAGDARGGTTDGERGVTAGDVERVLGALVLESDDEPGAHVAAIGVRRRHRARGVGTALIDRALEREGRLTARFDDDVRPFYDRLGFAIEPVDDSRYRGVLRARERT